MQRQPMKINWMQNYWPKSKFRHPQHAIYHMQFDYINSLFSSFFLFFLLSCNIRLRNTIAKSLSIDSDDSCDENETEEQLRKWCFVWHAVSKSINIDHMQRLCDNDNAELFSFFLIEKRREFESRRKLHYNEFEAVRRARQLMEHDEENDEDVENEHSNINGIENDSNMDMDDDDKLGSGSSSSVAVRL